MHVVHLCVFFHLQTSYKVLFYPPKKRKKEALTAPTFTELNGEQVPGRLAVNQKK